MRNNPPGTWTISFFGLLLIAFLAIPRWSEALWPLLPHGSMSFAVAHVLHGSSMGLWHSLIAALIEGAWSSSGAIPLTAASASYLVAGLTSRLLRPETGFGRRSVVFGSCAAAELLTGVLVGFGAERWGGLSVLLIRSVVAGIGALLLLHARDRVLRRGKRGRLL